MIVNGFLRFLNILTVRRRWSADPARQQNEHLRASQRGEDVACAIGQYGYPPKGTFTGLAR